MTRQQRIAGRPVNGGNETGDAGVDGENGYIKPELIEWWIELLFPRGPGNAGKPGEDPPSSSSPGAR